MVEYAATRPGTHRYSLKRFSSVLVISRGNEVYAPRTDGASDEYQAFSCAAGMARLAAYLHSRQINCKIVFGMSAAFWRYQGDVAMRFDSQVDLAMTYHAGLSVVLPMAACWLGTGAYELREILDSEMNDRIGRLQGFAAGQKLVYAIVCWLRYDPFPSRL